jgi:glyoxylase-like metal-dependent hydrolase (beta-lactamase superfamily II)
VQASERPVLPAGVSVFERGWLSANNVLLVGRNGAMLVDTGYHTHSQQTVELVKQALNGRPLDGLFNTHLHSDHCGGNSALQAAFPEVKTFVPPGQARHVSAWDPVALSYVPTGQHCPQFRLDGLLEPGAELDLGEARWQVHSAPGHDPHSVILFEPVARVLISADALWQNGFGIVFPELEGEHAFSEVAATLDLIESLAPHVVIPGHGGIFTDAAAALSLARRRLEAFVANPHKHAEHAAKVLLKFKLLQQQALTYDELARWAMATAYVHLLHDRYFPEAGIQDWIAQLTNDLVRTGAATRSGERILNA